MWIVSRETICMKRQTLFSEKNKNNKMCRVFYFNSADQVFKWKQRLLLTSANVYLLFMSALCEFRSVRLNRLNEISSQLS